MLNATLQLFLLQDVFPTPAFLICAFSNSFYEVGVIYGLHAVSKYACCTNHCQRKNLSQKNWRSEPCTLWLHFGKPPQIWIYKLWPDLRGLGLKSLWPILAKLFLTLLNLLAWFFLTNFHWFAMILAYPIVPHPSLSWLPWTVWFDLIRVYLP